MQSEKKQLEILLMHYFRESYNIFPAGKLIPSESPDFMVKIKKKFNLRIELTRLNPLNAKTLTIKELERDQLRDEVIDRAKDIFTQSSAINLFVKILFSDKEKLNPGSSVVLSARLTNLIRNSVQDKNTGGFFHKLITGSSLPKELGEILIIHDPVLKTSVWERSNNLGISENVPEDIQLAIQKKDEKLILYQKQQFNSYWLIITTDRLRGTKNYNLQNKVLNQQFHSRFQQVFLFDLMRANIFRVV